MVCIWDDVQINEKDTSKPLPFIFPILLYHGKQKWNLNTSFASMQDIPEGIEEFALPFHYFLLDLFQFSDDEIKGKGLSQVTLLLFKHIFDEDVDEKSIRICSLLCELLNKNTAFKFLVNVL